MKFGGKAKELLTKYVLRMLHVPLIQSKSDDKNST